jgi:hypothetical protein
VSLSLSELLRKVSKVSDRELSFLRTGGLAGLGSNWKVHRILDALRNLAVQMAIVVVEVTSARIRRRINFAG